MDHEIKVFDNPQFGSVRTVMMDGEPWFVAADVCKALEIKDGRTATARLDDDERGSAVLTRGTTGGNPNATVVNESGLYSLVLGSRKPEAKSFKRWITHDVIPAIRKQGFYANLPQDPGMASMMMLKEVVNQTVATFAEQDKRLAILEAKSSTYDEAFSILASEPEREWKQAMRKQIIEMEKTAYGIQTLYQSLYEELEYAAHVDLRTRVKHQKERARAAGTKVRDVNAISKLSCVAEDPKLRQIFDTILKRRVVSDTVTHSLPTQLSFES